MLVCPDCGNSQFTQKRSAVVEVTLEVTNEGYLNEVHNSTIEETDEGDTLTCTDCFSDWYDEDLITEERYNEDDE